MFLRLTPNQIQKLLVQYLAADYEQPISVDIIKAVSARGTDSPDTLLLPMPDLDAPGQFEVALPRAITALETYCPSCKKSLPPGFHITQFPLLTVVL